MQGMFHKLLPSWLRSRGSAHDAAVRHRSAYRNIYHCTVQKSASQWLRALLADPRTFPYCGMRPLHPEHRFPNGHDPRPLKARHFDAAFPIGAIVTPFYVSHAAFAALPRPEPYRALFVMRDPRDVVTSWYFSIKFSHPS